MSESRYIGILTDQIDSERDHLTFLNRRLQETNDPQRRQLIRDLILSSTLRIEDWCHSIKRHLESDDLGPETTEPA